MFCALVDWCKQDSCCLGHASVMFLLPANAIRTFWQEQVQWQTCHKAAQQLPGLRLALAQALSAAYLVAA